MPIPAIRTWMVQEEFVLVTDKATPYAKPRGRVVLTTILQSPNGERADFELMDAQPEQLALAVYDTTGELVANISVGALSLALPAILLALDLPIPEVLIPICEAVTIRHEAKT